MRNAVEFLKNRIATKKMAERNLADEISESTKVLSSYRQELRELDIELSRAEIAALGAWRPPANDEYWKRAAYRRENENDVDYRFASDAFARAGLCMWGMHEKTRFANFTVIGFEEADLPIDTLRDQLVVALKAFAEIYPGNEKIFNIGTVKDNSPEDDEDPYAPEHDPNVDFVVCLSKDMFEEKTAKLFRRLFTGPDYIENLVEEVLKSRAALLDIPYERPAASTTTSMARP